MAAKIISDGRVSVNGQRIKKPSTLVCAQDQLKFRKADWCRVIDIVALGTRRGSAPEAQKLYLDLSEPVPQREKRLVNPKFEGKGRPTGRQRRAMFSFLSNKLD